MKYLLTIILLFLCKVTFSQGIKVTDVKETVSGTDAFHAPIDSNGHPCGLVKVLAVFSDLRFNGSVVGDVSSENNEYKVYLEKGSKQLVIKRSGVLPVIVDFPTYGIPEISSKATYTVKLKEVTLNPQKNSIVIDTKPRNAKVYIDDILIDNDNGDGGYQLLLPKGEHLCRVDAKGYRSFASVIRIGKGPQTINAELESLLADIDISCQTSGAHIFVDGEEVGVGSWKGKLPAGTYKVEVLLDGYFSQSQSVVLEEKDNRTISIPALKRAKGNVVILTNIDNAIVSIDGSLWQNPRTAKELQTGNHIISVKAPFGYKEVEREIMVKTDSYDTIHVLLPPKNEMYARAFAGDVKAMVQICYETMESSKFADKDSLERNYWFERLYEQIDGIDKESFEMICPCTPNGAGCDMEQAGIYTYFCSDTKKGIRILQKWNEFDPNNDCVVLEMTALYSRRKDYEAVTKWGTKGLNICGFEGYMGGFMDYIAEACIMLGDVNRAVTIFKKHIDKNYGWENGYLTIANVYKTKGDCKNAVIFYKKFLQAHTSDSYGIDEAKKGIRDCGY